MEAAPGPTHGFGTGHSGLADFSAGAARGMGLARRLRDRMEAFEMIRGMVLCLVAAILGLGGVSRAEPVLPELTTEDFDQAKFIYFDRC